MIDIPDIYARAGRPVYSFEFFLPKAPDDLDSFVASVRELKSLHPDFVTLTYGAGGSARSRTVEAAGRLQRETGLTTACHLTCVGHSRAELSSILDRLQGLGVSHLVALRGDPPKDCSLPLGELKHADELVRLARAHGGFRLGVAAYPEKHPESASADDDLARFAGKMRAGADWAITQLFFDPADYFAFVARARAAGVTAPIVPGVMPATGYAQLKRFTALCGARVPDELDARLAAVQHDPARLADEGVAWAARQCRALLDGGAPGVHFYTLNRSDATARVLAALRRA